MGLPYPIVPPDTGGVDPTTLGTMALQNANAVAITGGTISGVTITDSTISAASVIGLGSMAYQSASNVAITGGTASLINLSAISMDAQYASFATADLAGGTLTGVYINSGVINGAEINGSRIGWTTQASGAFTELYANTLVLQTPLSLTSGGTGADNAPQARTNLGLGTMATQNANAVAITGGTISGVTIAGLGSMSLQDANAVAITGGTMSGVTITGSTIPSSNVTGLGTMATQNSNAVAITGGTISGVAITASTVSLTSPLPITSGGTGANTVAGALTNLGISTFSQGYLDETNLAGFLVATGLQGGASYTLSTAGSGSITLDSSNVFTIRSSSNSNINISTGSTGNISLTTAAGSINLTAATGGVFSSKLSVAGGDTTYGNLSVGVGGLQDRISVLSGTAYAFRARNTGGGEIYLGANNFANADAIISNAAGTTIATFNYNGNATIPGNVTIGNGLNLTGDFGTTGNITCAGWVKAPNGFIGGDGTYRGYLLDLMGATDAYAVLQRGTNMNEAMIAFNPVGAYTPSNVQWSAGLAANTANYTIKSWDATRAYQTWFTVAPNGGVSVASTLQIGGSTGYWGTDQNNNTGTEFRYATAGIFRMTSANIFGTNAMFFQMIPAAGNPAVVESATGTGLVLGTDNASAPVIMAPGRVERARFEAAGMTIGGTLAVNGGLFVGPTYSFAYTSEFTSATNCGVGMMRGNTTYYAYHFFRSSDGISAARPQWQFGMGNNADYFNVSRWDGASTVTEDIKIATDGKVSIGSGSSGISKILHFSGTSTATSIAANAIYSFTITATGAIAGYPCIVGVNTLPVSTTFPYTVIAYCVTNGQIVVQFQNISSNTFTVPATNCHVAQIVF